MRLAIGLVVGLVCSSVFAADPIQRTLTFDERVNAQAAIERVYYSHQIGTTKSFDQAVPKSVLENKVRKYLEQTAALRVYWKTEVTDQSLQRELERMAQGTRMPERLTELYAALGNDPFLVKECLARPALVDRLTHNFYAFDPTLHVNARELAEELHRRAVAGELNPSEDHPNRTINELVVVDKLVKHALSERPVTEQVTREEFLKRRGELPEKVGQVSNVKETRDGFTFKVILSESKTSLRVANYTASKITWDAWWETARQPARGGMVEAVALGRVDLPVPNPGRRAALAGDCEDDTWNNGSLDDVPEARWDHTAVWTGSAMILWGGTEGSYFSRNGYVNPHPNQGWRYDPATDTWTSISTMGAPTGRFEHVAVWTGHVMVVWGGTDGNNHYFDTGGRYDPATDTWSPTSTIGAPFPRTAATAVWTGQLMLVWGGYSPTFGGLNDGKRYDPTTDTWTAITTLGAPVRRALHTAVWTGRVMVVWGGIAYESEVPNDHGNLRSGGRYDPVTDTWSATSTLGAPAERESHAAVWTGREMIVWGGFGYDVGYHELSSGGRYNPTTDSWTATSLVGAPSGRYPVAAVWTGLALAVWGGGTYDGTPRGDGALYDPATDAWTPVSNVGAPIQRDHHTLVWTGNLVIVFGGFFTGGRYDPATDSWTPLSTAGAPDQTYTSSVWTGTQMVLWGRGTSRRYDPTTDAWSAMSTVGEPSLRGDHSLIWTGNRVVVWGGWVFDYYHPTEYFNDGGRYDPITDSWTATSTVNAPTARGYHSTVWTGSEMMVWGGDGGYYVGYLNSGGRYDPATDSWTSMSVVGAPLARREHTGVWTGHVMVVWGGDASTYPYETSTGGRYDPATDSWTPTSVVAAPTARKWHAAVWTGSRMVVWGGLHDNDDATGGGRYDPTGDTWAPTTTVGEPSGRNHFTAVWTGNRMIVWGGWNDAQVFFNTGGRYDPGTDAWTPTTTEGAPLARGFHTAVWTGRKMIVWGGGHIAGGIYIVADSITDDCDGDGLSESQGDCDDARASVYPGAPQICDGINNDCNDPVWPTVPPNEANSDGDAYPLCALDCNDALAWVYPGAPERCNGVDDDCDGVVDNGAEQACDDGNPCTDDVCGGAAGCQHINNSAACDDGNPCTSGDSCSGGHCSGAPVDSVACDDGNACTTGDACTGGICTGAPLVCDDNNICNGIETCNPWFGCRAGVPLSCVDYTPCTDDLCDPLLGCVFAPNTNPCDDGYQCTVDDRCIDGSCVGTVANGMHCEDGNLCTVEDTCYGYYCYGGRSVICNDDNPCTYDTCDESTGACVYFAVDELPCSDGNLCTQGDACHAGTCTSTPVYCASGCPPGFTQDGSFCTMTYDIPLSLLDNLTDNCGYTGQNRYTCQAPTYGFHWMDLGISLAAVSRVDVQLAPGRRCNGTFARTVTLNGSFLGSFTLDESCSCDTPPSELSFSAPYVDAYVMGGPNAIAITRRGTCEGLSLSEALGHTFGLVTVTYVPYGTCMVGSCAPATGACAFVSAPNGTGCSDDNGCTTEDACVEGACVGTPEDGAPCDDGNPCTGPDVCSQGACGGEATDCNDNNPCTNDLCVPDVGCYHIPNSSLCDDGNACTLHDRCDNGTCRGDPANNCDDGYECTTDLCDPAIGCVHLNNDNSCDDGSLCTLNDRCHDGECSGTPVEEGGACNDSNPCTLGDACRSGSCVGTPEDGIPCDDGNSCTTGDACLGGVCRSGSASPCDDNNPCTTDLCDVESGCFSIPNYNYCDDGNACTSLDQCYDGTCHGGFEISCDDGYECTTDSCDPAVGCVFANNDNPCDDGNACTVNDRCGGGDCVSGTPLNCDDGNVCTTDSCFPATGCIHTNNTSPCTDGNACTAGDVCGGGTCHSGAPIVCGPPDQCHAAGVCDPALGRCTNPNQPDGTVCNDSDLCTTGETCRTGTCTPAFSGLNQPKPQTVGYYKALCDGPRADDQLTDADAVCVASVARTFAGISTVAGLCAELRPVHPTIDPCDTSEDDLMVLALNICRARVCTAQSIESKCGGKHNVGQSLAESDAIFSSPSRNVATCDHASCLDDEINTGRALEMNSLTLAREADGVRLDWTAPYLDDGSEHPSGYIVWRRSLFSLTAFTKIASTTDPTYLDASSGSGAFVYEVTAVVN